MDCKDITVIMGFILLTLCGCDESSNPQSLQLAIEGDEVTKTAVEDFLKHNPQVVIPNKGTKYSIEIVTPDPDKNYGILRVIPDPHTNYSGVIIDPRTQQPSTTIDPEVVNAIIESLQRQKQKLKNK